MCFHNVKTHLFRLEVPTGERGRGGKGEWIFFLVDVCVVRK